MKPRQSALWGGWPDGLPILNSQHPIVWSETWSRILGIGFINATEQHLISNLITEVVGGNLRVSDYHYFVLLSTVFIGSF
jgi:hypothetical protein